MERGYSHGWVVDGRGASVQRLWVWWYGGCVGCWVCLGYSNIWSTIQEEDHSAIGLVRSA